MSFSLSLLPQNEKARVRAISEAARLYFSDEMGRKDQLWTRESAANTDRSMSYLS